MLDTFDLLNGEIDWSHWEDEARMLQGDQAIYGKSHFNLQEIDGTIRPMRIDPETAGYRPRGPLAILFPAVLWRKSYAPYYSRPLYHHVPAGFTPSVVRLPC